MTVLLIAEHDNHQLKPATLHALTAAKQLQVEVDILVIGSQCQAVAETAAHYEGVAKVLVIDNAAYAAQLPENISQCIASIGKQYTHIIAAASTFGKQIMPRVAALLDVEQISDLIGIIDTETFIRPIYAGNALATVKTTAAIKVLTIRPSAFAIANKQATAASIENVDTVFTAERIKLVNIQATASTRPELGSARVVISGGRGLQNAENFRLLESLADKLGAAIGASRAAVDAGFVPNDYQVGQTGKVVAPDLYIAVGISGAIQHLAGMKDSKVIVAINKDPDAPIFQIADYGLVGDLFTIIPELEAELSK
jgi:electron transfer flavoprotein alpha subunit